MKATETSRLTYARVAGFAFLFYIVAGIVNMSSNIGKKSIVPQYLQ